MVDRLAMAGARDIADGRLRDQHFDERNISLELRTQGGFGVEEILEPLIGKKRRTSGSLTLRTGQAPAPASRLRPERIPVAACDRGSATEYFLAGTGR